MREPVINEVRIRRDAEGRYNLNDLHRASGSMRKNAVRVWLSNRQAMELRHELTGPHGFDCRENRPIRQQAGPDSGIYAIRELALAYALWISQAFHAMASKALGEPAPEVADLTLPPAAPEASPRFSVAAPAAAEVPPAALVVAEIGIRQDAQGRYCLNDLHRAAGGEKKHQPSDWLRTKQTQELIAELSDPGIPGSLPSTPGIPGVSESPVVTAEGKGGGTYVVKEMVYAYAMWISPAFHLRVIRAYDALVTGQAFNPASLSRMQLLEMAMQAEREKEALAQRVETLEPKAQAHALLTESEGSLCLTDAAKVLDLRPKDFIAWLHRIGWIFRRHGGSAWIAYQSKVKTGYLAVKVFTTEGSDRTPVTREQTLVTPKGMAKLADLRRAPKVGNGE